MKYRIFIDTNSIWDSKGPFGTLFSPSFSDLPEFLKKHSVKNTSICLPQIVISERIQQRIESIDSNIIYINERIKSLKEAGHLEEEIKPRTDYKEKLQKHAEEFCKKYDIEIITYPSTSVEELTEWAINKKKPFNDHGSGFKDTLIYLSIIQDVKENKGDVYIFCTNNNKQFEKEIIEDFKKKTNKELIILPDLVSVQQKLDKIIPVGLHLEKRNEEVKNLVNSKLGDLMRAINKTISNKNSYCRNLLALQKTSRIYWNNYDLYSNNINIYTKGEDEADIAGYNFSDINFSSIEEMSENNIQVKISLITEIVYKEDNQDSNTDIFTQPVGSINFPRYSYGRYKPSSQGFDLVLDCDMKKKNVSIETINDGLISSY